MLFFSYSLAENKFPFPTHYWIISLYSINIRCNIVISKECFNFFWNMFNSKTFEVSYIFSIYISCYTVSSNWFILIKICYIWTILYFTLHWKPYFLFPDALKRWSFQKKDALEYDLSCINGKDDISFSQKYDLIP